MTKKKIPQSRPNQLTLWVGIFIVVIVLAWIFSWRWMFDLKGDVTGKEELRGTVAELADDWQEFNQDLTSSRLKLDKVLDSLKQGMTETQERTKALAQTILDKIDQDKLSQWPEISLAGLSFHYPVDWQLLEEDNQLELLTEEQAILDVSFFTTQQDLPDNINKLSLFDWLTEQVNRDLGVFTNYQVVDSDWADKVYQVNSKDSQVNYFWQTDGIYWLRHTDIEAYQTNINLIISSIKNNDNQEEAN